MGFLKKFFQPPNPVTLEVVPKPQQKETKPAPVSFPQKSLLQIEPPENTALKPDERVLAIETHAMALGWTWDQLWKDTKRPDLRGLAAILQKDQVITSVTPQYIQLERIGSTGKLEIQRFYNHNTDQPWLRRGSP